MQLLYYYSHRGVATDSFIWYANRKVLNRGFIRSKINLYLIYEEGLVLILHINNYYIFEISYKKFDEFIYSLKCLKNKAIYLLKDSRFDFTTDKLIKKLLDIEIL